MKNQVHLARWNIANRPIFRIISNNMADTWLHVGIAAVSLILGFAVRETPERVPAS